MTAQPNLKVLLVEDDRVDQIAFQRAVSDQGLPYQYMIAGSIGQAREILANEELDVVISDFSLGDGNLFDILGTIVDRNIPLIVTTGTGNEGTAVKAIKSGANDYIIKDTERNYLKIMATTIEKALENKKVSLERKHAEEALRLSEERFSKAFNGSPIAMSISNLENGKIIDVNDSFCRLAEISRNKILGYAFFDDWFNPADYDFVIAMIKNRETVNDMEFSFRKKSGEIRVVLYSAELFDINHEPCILSIIMDITDRKQAEEEIRYLSFYDRLTGLYNRAFFEEELRRIDTKRQLPICLIMGDLNGLKLINDSMGHQEGDKLLIRAAGILRNSCRKEDIVARWGGDEFIILLPGCDSEAGARIVEQIQDACKMDKDLPIEMSISLGLACKSCLTQDIHGTIKEAEDKMYRNKLVEARSTRSSFISSLEKTLWAKSHETKEHCLLLQEMALKIGYAIDLSESELNNLRMLACFHDIGKIAVPNGVLDKPGKCSPAEWEALKKHPEIGYRIALSSPELAPIAEAILCHHEHWDGQGYPFGLQGEEIPLMSRIITIVDAYDVLINGRPYQQPVSQEEAWIEIARCAGRQFDPELVSKALELNKKDIN